MRKKLFEKSHATINHYSERNFPKPKSFEKNGIALLSRGSDWRKNDREAEEQIDGDKKRLCISNYMQIVGLKWHARE